MTYAANSGGRFGEILNKILASRNWETDTTGTVYNAEKFNGSGAESFVKVQANQSCGNNTCIVGFESNGTVKCSN
jgi:hypothetical protein